MTQFLFNGVSLTEKEKRVWEAIRDILQEEGDEDIRAGLGWLSDETEQRIAQAAIKACEEP